MVDAIQRISNRNWYKTYKIGHVDFNRDYPNIVWK